MERPQERKRSEGQIWGGIVEVEVDTRSWSWWSGSTGVVQEASGMQHCGVGKGGLLP